MNKVFDPIVDRQQAKLAAGHKVPLLRIVRRPTISQRKAWLIRGVAFVSALLTGALMIALLGHNPFVVYADMLVGALGTKTSLIETVKNTIPLLVAALSVALSFKMQFWNIGAEGQILAGGIAASYFALFWFDAVPSWLLLCIMMVAAALAGALWGGVPAFFKAKWNTNETLFTLMLNYVALGLVKYLQAGPWKKPGGFPKIAMFDQAARLPKLFGVHIGWIIAIAAVIFVAIYLTRSKHGYETTVVGQSANTAKYSGMSVTRVIIRTMVVAGALAGLVGFMQVAGADYTLNESTAGGVGFTAITVAWLAQLQPVAMVAVAAFIAILQKGANRIHTTFNIPATASEVLIGIILFFMLGCEFFINYRLILRKKGGQA
ncbi:MAG: ABC transporter permease [Bacillota bacterium]|nr:ABC transporter permease [Bacillota bacterium]